MKNSIIKKLLCSLLFLIIIVGIWWVIALIVDDGYSVAFPNSVIEDMLKIFYVKEFYLGYFSTLLRAFIGFAISFALGFVLALLSLKNKVIKALCSPFVSFIKLVPTMAIASLLCLVFNSPEIASVLVCFTIVMPFVYSSVYSLLLSVDDNLLQMAKAYEIPFNKVVSKIYVPTIKSGFINLIGSSFSFALKITVSSEIVVGVIKGLGGIISQGQNVYLSPSLVIATTLWIVITGLVVEFVLSLVANRGKVCK